MIEVNVESIRVSLINQSRLVVLREKDSSRYLSIWIGAFEADAITVGLQEGEVPRPLTHQLIYNLIDALGAKLSHISVSDLREDTFFAELVLDKGDDQVTIDARPSDAIALAVRGQVPIFVSEDVMERAGQLPAPEFESETEGDEASEGAEPGPDLDVFRDFVNSLDLGDVGKEDEG